METKQLRLNDFFCGAGGIGLGFKQAGFEITGAWDINKYAIESYKENVSDIVELKDIMKMNWSNVPYAEVWSFGFPCQDISIAGRQAGMIKGETRSGLFYEIMRLLNETRENCPEHLPKIILAENVKAVRKYLPTIEEEYKENGYKMFYVLYDSKYWNVPQHRERYFIVGVHESILKDFAFPPQQTTFIPKLSSILEDNVDEKYYINNIKATKILEEVVNGLKVKQATKRGYDIAVEGDAININQPASKTRRGRIGKQISQTLTTQTEQVVVLKKTRNEYGKTIRKQYESGEVKEQIKNMTQLEPRQDGISNTLTTVQKDNYLLEGVHACITPDRLIKRQNGRRIKDNEEEMFTLTAQDLHGVVIDDTYHYNPQIRVYDNLAPTLCTQASAKKVVENQEPLVSNCWRSRDFQSSGLKEISPTLLARDYKDPHDLWDCQNLRIRKLTPREYARLQGFPDSYKQVVSNSQFYKQMGNAVTVTVARAIAEAIINFLY